MKGGGGTYIRFTVGGRGASAKNVAYISRVSAVRDEEGRCGFILHGMPEEIARDAANWEELRARLIAFAYVREETEIRGRTHYRTVISFERKVESERAAELIGQWLREAFPGARAMAFVHQNTENSHVHVWLDARKPDGRKLHFSPKEYRRIDEGWNRIYCREIGRELGEHLEKKASKRLRRHERNGGMERGGAAGASGRAARGQRTSSGERAIAETLSADERAVREVSGLRQSLAGLDRAGPRRGRESERER